jgi:hypothetical protein
VTDDQTAMDDDETQPDESPAEPGEPPAEPEVSTREKRFEVIATFLLAFAALATAWTGYQASLWDGIQSSNYTQASAARTEAAQLRTEANQYRLADLSVFENFIDASIAGDEEIATFYRDRFRPEFEVAFDAWIALDPFDDPDAPPSPLAMPEYQLAADAEAASLDARADTLFREGEEANTDSDIYTMSTLLFAIVLFFAAISERFAYVRVRVFLLSVAAVGLVAGVAVAFGQPITTG